MSGQSELDALLEEIMDMHPASCAIKLSVFAAKVATKHDALAARCEALAFALSGVMGKMRSEDGTDGSDPYAAFAFDAEWEELARAADAALAGQAIKVPDLASITNALRSAQAAMWDAHYGNGITAGYAQTVDAEIRAALSPQKQEAKP